jgi:hypothetical protein
MNRPSVRIACVAVVKALDEDVKAHDSDNSISRDGMRQHCYTAIAIAHFNLYSFPRRDHEEASGTAY